MKKVFLSFCAMAGTGLLLTVSAQKLQLKAGQKYQGDNVMKNVNTMEMMGQSMEITADVTTSSELEVKEKTADGYKAAVILKHMTTAANAMGQQVNYDSDKKEDADSEVGKMLKDKIGVATEITIAETGKVNTPKKEADKAAGGGNPMLAMMGGGQDENAALNDLFVVIPANSKVGDSWSDSTIIEGVKTYRNFTIKSINGDNAEITLGGKQLINRTVDNQGMEATVNLETKLSGTASVEVSSGIVKQRVATVEGTGTTEVMGQSIPMTTKIEMTSTIK